MYKMSQFNVLIYECYNFSLILTTQFITSLFTKPQIHTRICVFNK